MKYLLPLLFVAHAAFGSVIDYGPPQDILGHWEMDLYDTSGAQRGTAANPLYFKSYLLGGQTLANSMSVGIATDQFSLMSTAALQNSQLTQLTNIANNTASALNDIISTGNITTACAAGGNSCAATSYVNVAAQGQYTIGISISGTFSGGVLAEAQNADNTWTSLPMYSVQAGIIGVAYSSTLVSAAQVIVIAGSYSNFRIRCYSYASGTIAVALDASIAQQAVYAAQLGVWQITTKFPLTANAPAQATVGTTAATVLAANTVRKGLVLTNNSANKIYIGFGATAVSGSGIVLLAGGTFTMNEYTYSQGLVSAIASAAGSALGIQEFQ